MERLAQNRYETRCFKTQNLHTKRVISIFSKMENYRNSAGYQTKYSSRRMESVVSFRTKDGKILLACSKENARRRVSTVVL